MRKLIWIVFILLIACHKKVSETKPDASSLGTQSADPLPDNVRRMKSMRAKLGAPPKMPETRPPAKPSPHMAECMRLNADKGWGALNECFLRPKTASSDAGHLYGATRPPPSCPALAVPQWHIAPGGNNENTCVDSGHPCADMNEIELRLGCGAVKELRPQIPSSQTTIFIHGDMPQSSSFVMDPILLGDASNSGGMTFSCDLTQVAASGSGGVPTMSGVVNINHAGSQATNANLGSSTASYVGLQVVNTTHASVAWVDSIVSGNVALLSPPLSVGGSLVSWSNGDSFTIQQPSKLWVTSMSATCQDATCYNGYPNTGAFPLFDNCWMPKPNGETPMVALTNVRLLNSRIDGPIKTGGNGALHGFNSISTHAPIDAISLTWYGGSLTAAGAASPLSALLLSGAYNEFGPFIQGDVLIHGTLVVNEFTQASIAYAYCDNVGNGGGASAWSINGYVFPFSDHTPFVYGNCNINQSQNGYYSFESTDGATTFGTGVTISGQYGGIANVLLARDFYHTPVWDYVRAFSVSQLFTDFRSGGFSGVAISDDGFPAFYNWDYANVYSVPSNPTSIVLQPGQGGTGMDAGCPAGTVLEGDDAGGIRCSPICGPNDVVVTDSTGTTHVCSAPSPQADASAVLTWEPSGGISSLSGLGLWLEQDKGVHLSGSNVTQWDDQSGNANNATNSGNFPTFSASGGPGGSGRLTFASGQWLQSTTNVVASGHDRTTWVVGLPVALDPAPAMTFKLGTPYATFQTASNGGSAMHLYSDGVTVNNTTTAVSSVPHLMQWSYTLGAPITYYLDGVSQTVSGGNTASDTGTAGYQLGRNSAGQNWGSDIEEIIVIDHIASSSERSLVGGYIATKYGLTISGATPSGWSPETIGAPHSVVVAETSPAFGFVTPSTAGQCLCSNSASVDPSFQAVAYSSLTGTPTLPTVAGGTAISVTGGPAYTVNNTGVTSVTCGSGLSCSASTGGITISDTDSLPDPVTVPHGGTGDTSLSAHGYLLGQGTSDVTVLGACGLGNIPYGQGSTTDPICSTFKLSGPGPSGNVLTSDGTNWNSSTPGTPSTITSAVNHGSSIALSQGSYATLATNTMTIVGTVVDCTADIEWDPNGQTGGATMQFGISEDSSTTPSATRDISQGTNQSLMGALVESYTGVGSGSHTYRLLAEMTTTCPGCTSNTARGDILCLQH